MNKNLLKNQWVLVGLLFVISIVLSLVLFTVIKFFQLGSTSLASTIGIMGGALIVGRVYIGNFKEVMPNKLRLNVTIIYVVIQVLLVFLYAFTQGILSNLLIFGTMLGLTLLYSVAVYFIFGIGGKSYLQALQKMETSKK